MTRDEDKAQHVVADLIVECGIEVGCRTLYRKQAAADFLMFQLGSFGVAEVIDGAALGGEHEPGPGVGGNSRCGPLLERGHESFLGEVFGKTHIANHARESPDDFGGLHPPDRFNGAMALIA